MSLTQDINQILNDFGNFMQGIYHKPFGYFYTTDGHKISLYWNNHTTCPYYAFQCQVESCPGFGHKSIQCPSLKRIALFHYACNDRQTDIKDIIESQKLIKKGFSYQMIVDDFGVNNYFDDKGQKK